jgi:hypothetical protein
VQFGARAVISPELIASGEGTIDHRGNPIVGTCGVERNLAMRVAEARDAAGRIVIIGSSALRSEESRRQRDAEEGR